MSAALISPPTAEEFHAFELAMADVTLQLARRQYAAGSMPPIAWHVSEIQRHIMALATRVQRLAFDDHRLLEACAEALTELANLWSDQLALAADAGDQAESSL